MARTFNDKFDLILRHWRDRSGTQLIDEDLQQQLDRWIEVRTQLLEHPNENDAYFLEWIQQEFDIKSRTAWQCLQDTRKFFAATDTVNREFERVMQIAAVKKDIARFSKAESLDNKALMAARKLLADLTGANRPDPGEGAGGNNVIINVLNYDPSLITGAQAMPVVELDKLIADMIAADQAAQGEGLR